MYNYYDGQNQNMSPYNNYGRKTLTPFTITQYVEQPPVDVNALNDRVAQLENMIAEIKEEVSGGKSNTGNDAKPTKKQGRATSSLIPE